MTTPGMVVCPSCQSENPAGIAFCGACGTALGGDERAAEDRRPITIVTSDWKGSTSIGERLDAESLREVQTRYFDEMRLVFEAHGGVIEKIIGDAIVAVFGQPTAHDNDPLRAVAAAAESLRTLASLNELFEQAYGIQLVVRTGVASGDVIIGEGDQEHLLTGDVPTVATAMEQNAPPNEVLIADSTRRLLGAQVEAEPMGTVPVKGSEASVSAYRLVAISDDADRALREAEAVEAGSSGKECVNCGAEIPSVASKRCENCGASLATAGVPQERRKTVTIVFANPRISVQGGGTLGPRDLQEVMSRYFRAMRTILEKHGATVEKFIGDAVMAVFGLPVLHEDDALRASRAAIEMQGALHKLNPELAYKWGAVVQQQIGVNTGEVVAGDASRGERLVTGDVVNVAARLEQAAPPLEVLIGELTHRLVRDAVTVEPVEPLTLKGKAEPVPAYRLISVSQAVEGFRRREDSPMVGRETEMASLSEMLLRARHERAGRMATVVADAGTGKSRLIREFVNACDTTSVVIRGKCLSYGEGITFWPLVEAARGAASIGADDTPEVALGKLRTIIKDPGVADRIGATIGLMPGQFAVPEIQWATRKMLEEIGHEHPVIWVIDDIHWAEQTLLDLLVYLLDYCEKPLLLLCSTRPDLLESHADWGERPDSVRIILKPLSDADAGQVVHNLLGKAGIASDVQDRIVAAAEGNPLYVEQMLGMLIDSGRLRKVEDRWEPTVDLSQMVIPPSIQALLAARLDLLDQEERSVIEPASVIGAEFPQAAVAELAPGPIRDRIPPLLSDMSRKQLVRRSSSTNIDEAAYRFMHILIKDAAYGGILKRARADFHERFVNWAQRANEETGRNQEFEEIHGYHLEQAYRYLTELGPLDEHGLLLGARASDLLASAGRRALARGDTPATANLLRRAAASRQQHDRARLALLPDLGEALLELGEFDEARRVLAEAMALSTDVGDQRLVARALLVDLMRQLYAEETPDWTTLVAREVDRMIPIFDAAEDASGLALAWRMRVGMYGTTGEYGKAIEAAEKEIEYARAADDFRLQTKGAVAYALAAPWGPIPVAVAIARCEELASEIAADQRSVALIQQRLAHLYAMDRNFERARTLYASARSILNELGGGILSYATSLDSARVEILAGDYEAAARELERDYTALGVLGARYVRSSTAGLLARVYASLDRLDEAIALSREVELTAAEDDVDPQALWRGARACVLARRGEIPDALQLAQQALDLRLKSDSPVEQAEALADLAVVEQAAGRRDAAAERIHRAIELLDGKGDRATVGRLQGELMALSSAN